MVTSQVRGQDGGLQNSDTRPNQPLDKKKKVTLPIDVDYLVVRTVKPDMAVHVELTQQPYRDPMPSTSNSIALPTNTSNSVLSVNTTEHIISAPNVLLSTAIVRVLTSCGDKINARLLLDSGSTANVITESRLVQTKLGLLRRNATSTVTVNSAISQTSSISKTSARMGSLNKYYLYNQNTIRFGVEIVTLTKDGLVAAQYDEKLPTIVIVHGHEGSATSTLNPIVKDEILNKENVNVIIVDWSVYAQLSFSIASTAVPSVGRYLADFLNIVVSTETKSEDIHLIGFDLGAHVVGFAGRYLDGKIGKITGLDPSGSEWSTSNARLDKTDALFVEVVHTDGQGARALGIGSDIGHLDFFVNRGTAQPGCSTNQCNHNRAYEIMAASISTKLYGNKCNTMLEMTQNRCRGQSVEVGTNNLQKPGFGIFRVNTGATFPYALA